MESSRKILALALLFAFLVVLALLLWPRAERELRPQPRRAWVAIEVAGEGVARVGPVEIAAGTPFTLHAVLEAQTRGGETLYYTEAPALVVHGEEVTPEALRPWDRREQIKVLWFTVEGAVPYLKAEAPGGIQRFRFTEFLRLDWPRTWSVPGRIDPANDDRVERGAGTVEPEFGTQRYQVRIELFEPGNDLVPAARFTSPGADLLEPEPERFTTAAVLLPGPAAEASRYFGLTHLDLPAEVRGEPLARAVRLTREHLAYSQVPLLAQLMAAAARPAEDLTWRRVELEGEVAWGPEAGPGDLLQAGARWVVLYQDAGEPGRLDRGDLCFDFDRGAVIRPLDQVFTGGGEVDLARLSP